MEMEINVGVRPEVQQSQLMTRQAIQAIEILEYSQDELDAFVRDQLDRNPLLCTHPPEAPGQGEMVSRADLFPRGAVFRPVRSGAQVDVQDLAETIQDRISLRDYLRQQAGLLRLTRQQRIHVESLIDSLEPDGYLRTSLETLADVLEVPEDVLEQALRVVQTLEPAGVAARDLAECLRLQLEDRGQLTPPLEALLENLVWVVQGEPRRLARRCGVTVDALQGLLCSLRGLDPAPGLQFDTASPLPALPDVLVSVHDGGRVRVEMNPELLPRVLLDQEYFTELSGRLRQGEDKDFLQGCLRDANALIHHLEQRVQTILKIATEIIRNQIDFLYHGDSSLRPLLQKDIAQAAGVHESTVSRAIANKYMLCPRGLVPLKHFFSDGLGSLDGEQDRAATAIRHRIKDLVACETQGHILSDEAIVAALKGEGVVIARRTVAKYRDQLRIPSSAQRRRQMRWLASVPPRAGSQDRVSMPGF
uniref:RNA polymerase factor sigma-54 n=1 Tax=Castellaniella defragrans TaxID=75697 RepID=UPI003340DD40